MVGELGDAISLDSKLLHNFCNITSEIFVSVTDNNLCNSTFAKLQNFDRASQAWGIEHRQKSFVGGDGAAGKPQAMGHKLEAHRVGDDLFLLCSVCGCHAATRSAGLMKPCARRANKEDTRDFSFFISGLEITVTA